MARDYYDILGVSKAASADEIKSAHRKLVRKFHPDVNKNNPAATEKFKEVQEAYDVLSDDTRRKNYDQFGHAGVNGAPGMGGQPGGGDPFEAFRRAQQAQGRRGGGVPPGVSVEDFNGGGGNFGDIFEQLFGARGGGKGKARGGRAAAPERGQDVEHGVTLSFEQAARGTTLPLQIDRDGQVETIEIKVPPGVKDGGRIRVKGRGQQMPNGNNGDLYIVVAVTPHAYFRRDGSDIYLELPLSLYEACLGTKVSVPTLDGPVTLTIPPGTNSGAKLRIRGKGLPRPGDEKGDQFVQVRINVPKDLDADDREVLEKLSAKHPINARADLPWA